MSHSQAPVNQTHGFFATTGIFINSLEKASCQASLPVSFRRWSVASLFHIHNSLPPSNQHEQIIDVTNSRDTSIHLLSRIYFVISHRNLVSIV